MKTTIIFLGLAALSFNNSIAANELKAQDLIQQDLVMVSTDSAQFDTIVDVLKNKVDNTGEDTTVFYPDSVIKSTYVKTLADTINDNKLVTETSADTYQPIALEMSPEDIIAESNQIVESNIDNEAYPLDFEKINRSVKANKVGNNNVAIPVEIKL